MRAMSGTNGSSGFGSVSNEHIDKRTKREKEKITYFSSTMEPLNTEVLGITILFTPVIDNNYSPKWRWLVLDIYQGREAAR